MNNFSEKKGRSEKLSRRQETAITCLLTQSSIRAAADASGVGESTLRRWLQDRLFIVGYNRAKKEMFDGTINRLRTIAETGVKALYDIAKDPRSPATARVSAGRSIVDLMLSAVETQDLAERLDRLEQTMKGGTE